MRAVNLMPRDERGARLDLGRLPLLAAAGGIVVVTAAAFLLASSASSTTDSRKAELEAVEASIASVPAAPHSTVSVGTLAQERANRLAALAAALTRRTSFDRVLRDISLVFPSDAWLTHLEAAAPARAVPVPGAAPSTPSGAASDVTIQGAAFSHDTVATVLARLAVVPSLTGVRLTSSALVEPQAEEAGAGESREPRVQRAKPFVTFVVSASVRSEGSS